ncbi:hypothetical protein EJ110_NYTH28696 [Nymphaea thermarum]|nr:hypothetical protein EJ110_NYTH28696 [Nymphaea thermarum]
MAAFQANLCLGPHAVQGHRVMLYDVLGVLGSRLPNLGVLGKTEYLSLEFTHPWMSALSLQWEWIYIVSGHHGGCLLAVGYPRCARVLVESGQQSSVFVRDGSTDKAEEWIEELNASLSSSRCQNVTKTGSYGYVKYRISNPSSKRRETDTQFQVNKQNSILNLIDTYRILWKVIFNESRMYSFEGALSYLWRSTLQYGVKKLK